ncbi:LPS export ABC transporter periplasmic protein LptC, partial [candidate division KSB1 bacterium]
MLKYLYRTGWLATILLVIVFCKSNSPEDKLPDINKRREPDQEYWDFTITLSSRGIPYAKVVAGHSSRYVAENYFYLDQKVKVDFFDDNGNHSSILTAEKGIVDENSNNMTARENVVVVSDSGITLLTEELKWIEKENKIFTDKFVTVITSRDTIYGYGFISDRSL